MATETEIERLVVSFVGKEDNYLASAKRVQDATKATEMTVKASGKEVQNFYKELRSFAEDTQSTIDNLGMTDWFKSLTKDVQTAAGAVGDFGPAIASITRPIESAGGAIGRWTDLYSRMKASLGEEGLFDKAKKAFSNIVAVVSTSMGAVVPMVTGAFAKMSAAVVGSVKAMTAAVVASPAVVLVAVGAIAAGLALAAGSIMKLRQQSEETEKFVSKFKAERDEKLKEEREGFSRDASKSETLRGVEKIEFDLKRLEEADKKYEEAGERLEALQEKKKKMETFQRVDWGFRLNLFDFFGTSQDAKVNEAAIVGENERLDQLSKEREKALDELFKQPLQNVTDAHRGYTQELQLLGISGVERDVKKVEGQLKDMKLIRDRMVDDLGYDPDDWAAQEEDPRLAKMDEDIRRTEVAVQKMKEAGKELEEGRAVQKTKEQFDGLNKSLAETVEKLKVGSEQWDLYKLKKEAAARGVPLTAAQENQLADLMEDKKILEERERVRQRGQALEEKYAGGRWVGNTRLTHADDFRKKAEEIKEAHKEGALTDEAAANAIRTVTNEFNKAELAALRAEAATTKFNAALVGSAEYARRMLEYREKADMLRDAAAPPSVAVGDKPMTGEEKWQRRAAKRIGEVYTAAQERVRNLLYGREDDMPETMEDDQSAFPAAPPPPKKGERLPLREWLMRTGQAEAAGATAAPAQAVKEAVSPLGETLKEILNALLSIDENTGAEGVDLE